MINRWLIGLFTVVVIAVVVLAIVYPEDFAIGLAFLVLGFAGGMLISTNLMKTYFNQGASMVHEMQKKQITNPASILREIRLQEKEEGNQPVKETQQQQPIPRLDIKGL